MMLDEVRIFLHPLTHIIEERGFQSREAVVQSRDVRLRELVGLRITLTRQTVNDRATGITQSHHLRALVDSLTGSIVNGLSQHLHVVVGVHLDNLRVTTTDQQTEER